MRTLPRFVGLLLAIAACHGGGTNSSPRGGMVTDATAFPVVVSNLDTTAKFSWAGGAAKSLAVTRSTTHQTREQREANPVVWGTTSAAGFASPVTLNAIPAGAQAMTGAMGGMIGGQTYTVVVELLDGRRGSQKFDVPMTTGLGGACTPTSAPAASYGHCVFPFAGKGNLCTHYTGTAGANAGESKHTCEVLLKGTYGDGPCPATTAGQCLSRCGAPNESLDTAYFATPAEWKQACDARKGTYTP